MQSYSLAHLTNGELLHGLKTNLARERDALAGVLAHLAEVEERKLHVPAGYPSLQSYCMHELRLSKDAANKRIRAARAAREFPTIFERVADGGLGLSAVLILAALLTKENAEGLLAAAAFKSNFEIEELLAERYPREAVPTTIEPIPSPQCLGLTGPQGVAEGAGEVAVRPLQGVAKPAEVMPIAADLYTLKLTMGRELYDKLRHARELLAQRRPAPDEAQVIELGLDLLVAKLEKQKYAATDRPRAARRSKSARYIPAAVRRAVRQRDGGRCTFTSENGTRCPETKHLENDHIVPVARGGTSEPSNLRLRCRAHNQYEAEQTYGMQFMQNKREQARAAVVKRTADKSENTVEDELVPWLRSLGYSLEDARFAVAKCGSRPTIFPETRRLQCLAALGHISPKSGASAVAS